MLTKGDLCCSLYKFKGVCVCLGKGAGGGGCCSNIEIFEILEIQESLGLLGFMGY